MTQKNYSTQTDENRSLSSLNLMMRPTIKQASTKKMQTFTRFSTISKLVSNSMIQHPANKKSGQSTFITNKRLSLDASLTLSLLLPLLLLAFSCGPTTNVDAFQYDIWFKYPHPYTQSDPVNYCPEPLASQSKGACQSSLPIYVNTLDSPKTLIPYTINQLLDFCPLSEAREFEHSQHTEWDDNIRLAPFDIKFGRNEECKTLCKKTYKMTSHSDLYRLEELKLGLTRDYYHHWFTDTFPFAWCYRSASLDGAGRSPPAPSTNSKGKECFIGFPIGYSTDQRGLPEDERVPIGNFTKPNALFLFNHFDFTFIYESGEAKPWSGKAAQQAARITGLRIQPRSIDHELAANFGSLPASDPQSTTNGQQSTTGNSNNRCSYSMPPLEIPSHAQYGLNVTLQLSYTYSVRFVEDEMSATWSQRWHRLEATLPGTGRGRWILMGAFFLLAITLVPAAYAIAKTLLSDRVLMGLNPRDEADELAWKQLAGDIFREPIHIAVFSVLVGSGTQFIASIILSELFSAFIALFSTTILVFVVVLFVLVHGFVGGYVSIRLYRTFGGEQWRTICLFVTMLNPLVIFCLLVMSRNLLLLYNGSLMALNVGLFGSLFMAALCFAFSLPSALAGGSMAFKKSAIDFPVRPTANKRELSDYQMWQQPLFTTLVVAIIPFLCFCAVESYPFYDSGGYIITVITILIVISLSISHCYLHLNQHDYRWWWRSYLACAIAAVYYFIHCSIYILANLYIDTMTNALLYLLFAFFICLALFLLTGTLGFLVTFGFLWQTYARTVGTPGMNYAMFQKNAQIE